MKFYLVQISTSLPLADTGREPHQIRVVATDAAEAARLAVKHLQSKISESEKLNDALIFDIGIRVEVGAEVDQIEKLSDHLVWAK